MDVPDRSCVRGPLTWAGGFLGSRRRPFLRETNEEVHYTGHYPADLLVLPLCVIDLCDDRISGRDAHGDQQANRGVGQLVARQSHDL